MLYSFMHPGSGLGNQLHRYIMARVLALDNNTDFTIIGAENFKGKDFMNLDMGGAFKDGVAPSYEVEYPAGKIVVDMPVWEEGTDYYNPEINFVKEGVIDGEFQDERYFGHRYNHINEWLKVEEIDMPEDLCVINFRGGEFAVFPELFLPKEYWIKGISMMLEKNPNMKFEVHTDDEELAKQIFPDYKVIRDIGLNWRSIRYAKNLILANTSFCILPALIGEAETIIAPRYWARRNTGVWSMPQNFYKRFIYI